MKNFFFLLCLCSFVVAVLFYIIVTTKHDNNHVSILQVPIFSSPHLFGASLSPFKCTEIKKIVIIVTSYAGHVELRSAHRRAMPQQYLDQFNATRVFLLAQVPKTERYITQNAIIDESKRFNDILQGDFIENYRNLTYKHLMGLNWAGSNCSEADYVIKVDDDTVFNLDKIYSLLSEYNSDSSLMLGYVLNGTKPHREKQNKWFVTYAEYPNTDYPPYVSGWLYVTTPKTAEKLVQASAYHQYFWIDDIFITGMLVSDLGIKLSNLKEKNIWLEYYELLECCLRDMIDKNIKCDYAVAPNGGRNNLILEYNESLRKCNVSNVCKNRSDTKILKETCVVEAERTVFGKGESQINAVHL